MTTPDSTSNDATPNDGFDDALASVPPASPTVPAPQTPTPDNLSVPPPTPIIEGTVPPADIPVPPLSPDAIALKDAQAQIDALTEAGQRSSTLLEQYQATQRQADLSQTTDKLSQQLVNDGLTPERASQYAQFLANAQIQGQDAARESSAKTETARKFAVQYGVTPESLMTHGTPEAMQAAAVQGAEIIGLKKQMAEMRQGQLPAQVFDNGHGASALMTEAQRKAASGRGEYTATPEEKEKWLKDALAKVPGFN